MKKEEIADDQIRLSMDGELKSCFIGENLMMLLLVGEQPQHKRRGNTPHVHVLS
jgi:hypothetical protein